MRKLKKSELKRVYGGYHNGGDGTGSTNADTDHQGSGVSSDSPGGTSGDVSV